MTKAPLGDIAQKVARLKTPKDVEQFFRSFFTPDELETLHQRAQIIEHLLEGLPQREISRRIGVSLSQISRGSAELKFGQGKDFFPKFFEKKPLPSKP